MEFQNVFIFGSVSTCFNTFLIGNLPRVNLLIFVFAGTLGVICDTFKTKCTYCERPCKEKSKLSDCIVKLIDVVHLMQYQIYPHSLLVFPLTSRLSFPMITCAWCVCVRGLICSLQASHRPMPPLCWWWSNSVWQRGKSSSLTGSSKQYTLTMKLRKAVQTLLHRLPVPWKNCSLGPCTFISYHRYFHLNIVCIYFFFFLSFPVFF